MMKSSFYTSPEMLLIGTDADDVIRTSGIQAVENDEISAVPGIQWKS